MNFNPLQVIERTEEFVQDFFQGEATGHDWWHIHRVRKLALKIAEKEGADLFIVEMSSLLHDVGDYKFFGGDEKLGSEVVANFLHSLSLDETLVRRIRDITDNISFMKTLSQEDEPQTEKKNLEFNVVSDADKLDAMGAIGIARVFTYGGFYHRPIYDPAIPPDPHISREDYKTTENPSLNHFYEKLLKLKDMMATAYGRKLASGRHNFLLDFLKRFYREWEGEE